MSEFQELVKSFSKSREYVRDFFVYGFKTRDDFSDKSGRTYDNERRRIESWLSEYIHSDYTKNVRIISRGLLDCGALKGGDNKNKTVVNISCSENVKVEGLTVVNSNTWTMCAYSGKNIEFNRNLLLSYRTYSDGIMMSECENSSGRYNFVRTGDDAIEFKGTGWWGATEKGIVGKNCIYEYNDLWTDKGAGYCLTWENNCSMENISVPFTQVIISPSFIPAYFAGLEFCVQRTFTPLFFSVFP